MLTTNLMLASQKSVDQCEEEHSFIEQGHYQQHYEFIPTMKFGYCLTTVNAHDFLHVID